jgi:hypothetical protein
MGAEASPFRERRHLRVGQSRGAWYVAAVPWFARPALVFLAQRLVLVAVALWVGVAPFHAASWFHWDAFNYLDIAQRGYQPAVPCTVDGMVAPTWCGNTGWFPFYPLMVALMGRVGLSLELAALFLSATCQLGCLALLDRLLDPKLAASTRWTVLVAAAFFPGNVYLAAPFPVSLCLLGLLGAVALGLRARLWTAALAAAAAAAAYATGILLAPAAVVVRLVLKRSRPALAWGLGSIAGYVAVMLLLRHATGRWDSFFLVQRGYGYHLQLPFDSFGAHLKPLVNPHYWEPKLVFGALQTLSVTLLVGALLWHWRRWRFDPSKLSFGVMVLVFWLTPFVLGGRVSLYRAEAMLLPSVLLLPDLDRRFTLALGAAFVLVTLPMTALFFQNVLV